MRMDDIIHIQKTYPNAEILEYNIDNMKPDIFINAGFDADILLRNLESYEVEFAEAIGISRTADE